RLSELLDAAEPAISPDGTFELQQGRHPLLVIAARAASHSAAAGESPKDTARGPVPISIRIRPPASALLITGPNTGGKTVALKTAGLLALMAQSGLRIPAAAGSSLPVYRSVFADIGDEQSIDASLSTFSAHVANIAGMDRSLAMPALVLLDEVGS